MVVLVTVRNKHTEEVVADEMFVDSVPESEETLKTILDEIIFEEWGEDWKLLEVTKVE